MIWSSACACKSEAWTKTRHLVTLVMNLLNAGRSWVDKTPPMYLMWTLLGSSNLVSSFKLPAARYSLSWSWSLAPLRTEPLLVYPAVSLWIFHRIASLKTHCLKTSMLASRDSYCVLICEYDDFRSLLISLKSRWLALPSSPPKVLIFSKNCSMFSQLFISMPFLLFCLSM